VVTPLSEKEPDQAVADRVDQGREETMKNEDQPIRRRTKPLKIRTIIAAICAALAFSMAGAVSAHDGEAETVTKNFEAAIPNIPGKSLIALEVDYAPGATSPSHTHAKSAFIYAYVISGAIESKVNDGETRIYRAGESWSEAPGATHSISRNASKTEPAKLLAVFVLDTNDNPLTNSAPLQRSLSGRRDVGVLGWQDAILCFDDDHGRPERPIKARELNTDRARSNDGN
jgi:quercetin dioxygenase-like cupin family protein